MLLFVSLVCQTFEFFRAQNDLYIPNLIGLQKCNIKILWLYLGLKEEENLILIHA